MDKRENGRYQFALPSWLTKSVQNSAVHDGLSTDNHKMSDFFSSSSSLSVK